MLSTVHCCLQVEGAGGEEQGILTPILAIKQVRGIGDIESLQAVGKKALLAAALHRRCAMLAVALCAWLAVAGVHSSLLDSMHCLSLHTLYLYNCVRAWGRMEPFQRMRTADAQCSCHRESFSTNPLWFGGHFNSMPKTNSKPWAESS